MSVCLGLGVRIAYLRHPLVSSLCPVRGRTSTNLPPGQRDGDASVSPQIQVGGHKLKL